MKLVEFVATHRKELFQLLLKGCTIEACVVTVPGADLLFVSVVVERMYD